MVMHTVTSELCRVCHALSESLRKSPRNNLPSLPCYYATLQHYSMA